MSESLALNNTYISNPMINTKKTKEKVITKLKTKLENAKLKLIYTELENNNISIERKYSTVNELVKDLKTKLGETEIKKINEIIDRVEKGLTEMVNELEQGSTSSFTKIMTSDLAQTIIQSLGISLAGRTALILAPTLGTKAIVGTALAGYGLYRIIKNRKEIIKINEINELNNILSELEITKENDKIIDTRFDEKNQENIREYLKLMGVQFDDTGYLSLRQTIYALDVEKKKELCNHLNSLLNKNIDIDKRIKKAKRKLNVISSSAASIASGAALGMHVANTINSIDPALTAGFTNGFFISKWIESITDKKWFMELSSNLATIGTEILQYMPFFGEVFEKVFAVENLVTFSTIGATGGLTASIILSITSTINQLINNSKYKKHTKTFLEIDSKKYRDLDQKELNIINEKIHKPANMAEAIIVDIIYGYLKDENILLEKSVTSLEDLQIMIDKLSGNDRIKAKKLLYNINYHLNNDPDFIKDIKAAGKMAIGLFTSGIAMLSIYDIIKKGTFLPKLSQKLFPENNIHTPIESLPTYNEPLNPELEQSIVNDSKPILDDFINNEYYMTENNGDAKIEQGANIIVGNNNILDAGTGMEYIKMGANENALIRIFKWIFGIKDEANVDLEITKIPNNSLIYDKLYSLEPKNLYEFYRYFNTIPNDNSEMYNAIQKVLSYDKLLEKVTKYVNVHEKNKQNIELINEITQKLSTGLIPFSTALEILGIVQKNEISPEINNEHPKEISMDL